MHGCNSELENKHYRRIVNEDKFATSISKWVSVGNDSVKLNMWQEMAMNKAVGSQFQLIQGPPGKILASRD